MNTNVPTKPNVNILLTILAILVCAFATSALAQAPNSAKDSLDQAQASALASLAQKCINNQYPNVIRHHLLGPEDVRSPKELHPAFYGCLDWHSSVHGHWLLVRLLKTEGDIPNREDIIDLLGKSFSVEKMLGELAYFSQPGTGTTYERPYGHAWFLQLTAELRQWDSPEFRAWLDAALPLEHRLVEIIEEWLPTLDYPIRTGEHSQTAFAFGLMRDWARVAGNQPFAELLESRSKLLYMNDTSCPLGYEPSGQDFLSPCIAEADLMRRILSTNDFANWLSGFLPNIPADGSADWIEVAVVSDRTDGKLGHLDGLNLSRAWMLEGIASGLPVNDSRRESLISEPESHKTQSVPIVLGDLHYMGSHWLGSFATYLLTQRGHDVPQ